MENSSRLEELVEVQNDGIAQIMDQNQNQNQAQGQDFIPPVPCLDSISSQRGTGTIPTQTDPLPPVTLEFQLFPHSETPLHRQDHNRPFLFAPVEKKIKKGAVIQIGRKIDRVNKDIGAGSAPRGTTREDRALQNVSTDPAHMSTGDKSATSATPGQMNPIILDGDEGDQNVGDQSAIENTEIPVGPLTSMNYSSASTSPFIECIAFRSKVVSRHHAEFFVGDDGQLYFRDVGSSSGSFLNRLRLSATGKPSRPFPLKSGDVIQLGVDYQGRQEEIYKAVMIKIFINSKRSAPVLASKQRLNRAIRSLLHAMNPNSKKEDEANTTVECCICINSMSPFQALFLAPCSHCFHYKCVTTLLGAGFMFQCPLCRQVANLEASVAEPDDVGVEIDFEDEDREQEDVEMEMDVPLEQARSIKRHNGEKRSADEARLSLKGDSSINVVSSDEEIAGRLEMDVEPDPLAVSNPTSSIAVNIPGSSRSHMLVDPSVVSPSTPQNTSNLLTQAVLQNQQTLRRPDVPVQIFNTLTKLSYSISRDDSSAVRVCIDECAGQINTLLRGIGRTDEETKDLLLRMASALQSNNE